MQRQRALFLDRDGVINHDHGYVHTPEKFELMPGIMQLCRTALKSGCVLVIVTNQAGIARGYYTEEQYQTFTAYIREVFAAEGITLTGIYHCPHHPDFGDRTDHPDRKPNPGMLLRAAQDHHLNLNESIMVGDSATDMQAAKRAGVPTRIYFNTSGTTPPEATHHVTALADAIGIISPRT